MGRDPHPSDDVVKDNDEGLDSRIRLLFANKVMQKKQVSAAGNTEIINRENFLSIVEGSLAFGRTNDGFLKAITTSIFENIERSEAIKQVAVHNLNSSEHSSISDFERAKRYKGYHDTCGALIQSVCDIISINLSIYGYKKDETVTFTPNYGGCAKAILLERGHQYFPIDLARAASIVIESDASSVRTREIKDHHLKRPLNLYVIAPR